MVDKAVDRIPVREILFVAIVLVAHWAMGWTAWFDKSTTYDEIVYVTAGAVQWQIGDHRMTPMNAPIPHLWAGVPFLIDEAELPGYEADYWKGSRAYLYGWDFFYGAGNDPLAMLRASRGMMGIASALLCFFVWFWARKLWGPLGAGISLLAVALSPTLLSHGFLVTSDAMMALFLAATTYFFWSCLHRLTYINLILCALAASALFSTKISAPIFLFIAPVLVFFRLIFGPPMEVMIGKRSTVSSRWGMVGWTLVIAVFSGVLFIAVIWMLHGFRYSMYSPALAEGATPLTEWDIVIERLSGTLAGVVQFARSLQLLPEAFLYGYAIMFGLINNRNAFLAGDYSTTGWTEFFPLAFLWKSSLGLLILLVLAIVGVLLLRRKRVASEEKTKAEINPWKGAYALVPLLTIILIYGGHAVLSSLNIGHRHIMPIYPPVFVLAGAACLIGRVSRGLYVLPALALVILAVESFSVRPNYLTFFNATAGGPTNGYRLLVDSSLDWGQDLAGAAEWSQIYKEAQPDEDVYMHYFGIGSPSHHGFDGYMLEKMFYLDTDLKEAGDLTGGQYLISATHLQGVYDRFGPGWDQGKEARYQQLIEMKRTGKLDDREQLVFNTLRNGRLSFYLQMLEPEGSIGNSIIRFSLSDEEAQQIDQGNLEGLFQAAERRYLKDSEKQTSNP